MNIQNIYDVDGNSQMPEIAESMISQEEDDFEIDQYKEIVAVKKIASKNESSLKLPNIHSKHNKNSLIAHSNSGL